MDHLYYSSIIFNSYQDNFWNSMYNDATDLGKFSIDLGRRMNPNRFINRDGIWETPWVQKNLPKFEMPEYNSYFNKSFSDITDQRANDIKDIIYGKNIKFAVMYSGGIDSTLILCSLLKNLNKEELKNIAICTSSHSIIENPIFFLNYIKPNFTILDSSLLKYDDIVERGYRPLIADEGDCLFGTLFGLDFYRNYDYLISRKSIDSQQKLKKIKKSIFAGDTHYKEYKDILIDYLSLPDNINFGEKYYEKLDYNIKTSSVPIYSLHDFFWWLIFNLKYINCSIRGSIYYNDRVNCKSMIYDHVLNWFHTDDYQQWSMVNNNNGKKIKDSISSYKIESKKYIYDFNKDKNYFDYKLKLESFGHIVAFQNTKNIPLEKKPNARFGVDNNFNILYIDDTKVQDFIKESLTKKSFIYNS